MLSKSLTEGLLETSFPCIPQGYNHETVTATEQSTLSLEDIKETLKRCPEGTFEALKTFRENQDPEQIPVIVMGIIERHLEADSDNRPVRHVLIGAMFERFENGIYVPKIVTN